MVKPVENKNSSVTIWILAFIIIFLIIILFTISSGPKKVEKYLDKLTQLREKFENTKSLESRKKVAKKIDGTWKKLARNIQHNLIRIMKRNKHIDGTPIIHDNEERQLGIERLKAAELGETTMEEGTHTLNKFRVLMCDVNHPDDNTLAHVLIHEFAHVINSTIGHDEKWTRLFDILQDVAHHEGWFNRHKNIELATYCGGKYNG